MSKDKEARLTELFDWIYRTDEELYDHILDSLEKNRKGLLSQRDISEINDILMYKQAELQVSKFADFKKLEPCEIEIGSSVNTSLIRGGSSYNDKLEDKWATYFRLDVNSLGDKI